MGITFIFDDGSSLPYGTRGMESFCDIEKCNYHDSAHDFGPEDNKHVIEDSFFLFVCTNLPFT